MKIVTLIENKPDDARELACEHGLSLYIETGEKTILFDTGKTSAFLGNAQKLGIDVSKINAVVLSHGHSDHSGGLLSFLKENASVPIYMKKAASQELLYKCLMVESFIGVNREVFSGYSDRIRFADALLEICKDVFILSEISSQSPMPDANRHLFVRHEKRVTRDPFEHELALVIRENGFLHVFTGCAHKGVANILHSVRAVFKGEPIHLLCGGFHLMKFSKIGLPPASSVETDAVAQEILNHGIGKIYTGHCTGEQAFKRLRSQLGDKIEYLRTGTVIENHPSSR